MYVRKAIVKGTTYYQLAEGHRDAEGKVRTTFIVALGSHPTPGAALAAEKRTLAALRRERARLAWLWTAENLPVRLRRQRDSLDRRLGKSSDKVKLLNRVVKDGLVSTTKRGETDGIVPQERQK